MKIRWLEITNDFCNYLAFENMAYSTVHVATI